MLLGYRSGEGLYPEKYISSIYEISFVTIKNYIYLKSPFSFSHNFCQWDFANRPKEQLTTQTLMLIPVGGQELFLEIWDTARPETLLHKCLPLWLCLRTDIIRNKKQHSFLFMFFIYAPAERQRGTNSEWISLPTPAIRRKSLFLPKDLGLSCGKVARMMWETVPGVPTAKRG